ncbi:MAG: KH domain-containing protein [Acidimicrobiia bacterium]|nr:KH domain-containing protein [Acidimicrobiia bacterium]MCY4458532.1 KH domain-containing protein [Acidimicrobiaceae bacterium]
MSLDKAQAVCEYLVQQLVDDPTAVGVAATQTGSKLRLDVTVGEGDMGRVIGRRGRVAGAIRTVVRAAGYEEGTSIEVEFID